ncbi:MAG: hypothetical protein NZ899_00685 [Thermoguttaceae bacterium]|nr:hypothetical protein [Thermoguttaceae bacterium]MDW8077411.1 hypothetical protein [Thermoguttaceae bacterium]
MATYGAVRRRTNAPEEGFRKDPKVKVILRAVGVASILFASSILGLPLTTGVARADELTRDYLQLAEKYHRQLEELAGWCDENGLKDRGAFTRAWLRTPDPDKIYLPVIPKETGALALGGDLSGPEAEWKAQFSKLRRTQSRALFDLARRAIRAGRATWAFELLLAALRENPDDADIRRILGYQSYQGAWRTGYELRRLRAGEVWHPKFGWIPRQHVARYENGLRFVDGRWIPAEEANKLRSRIDNGWLVETERYRIITNHSLEVGVRLAEGLDRFYQVWRQLFVRFYATEAQVLALFDGQARSTLPPLPQMRIVCFANQEDFRDAMRPIFPIIDKVNITGVYYGPKRIAYFFWSEPPDWPNFFHEATHQLFSETRWTSPTAGARQNFWVIEGVALYMQTLKEENGFFVLGGWESQRVCEARYNLFNRGKHIPLEELVKLGMESFQAFEDLGALYSQCAAVMQFLMHYDYGRYRDAAVRYLELVYSGRDDLLTICRLTGKTFSELDKEYQSYMNSGPAVVASEISGGQ